MEANNYNSYFNNPVVVILVITLLGLGGYVLFSNKSAHTEVLKNNQIDNHLTNYQSIVPKQQAQKASQTLPVQTTQGNLLARQKTCTALLYEFENYEQDWILKDTTTINQMGWTATLSNWAVGYSPSLDACVGTYTETLSKNPCPQNYGGSCTDSSYSIVNIDTKAQISNYHSGVNTDAAKAQVYNDYKAKLSALTNGQLH